MRKNLFTRWMSFGAICTIVAAGCSSPQQLPDYERKSPDTSGRRVPANRPMLVGKVSLVNDAKKFALVEMQAGRVPNKGTVLLTYQGQMRSGKIRVSGEKESPFIIADIEEGLPDQEHLVYLPPYKKAGSSGSSSSSTDYTQFDGEAALPDEDYSGPVPELELLGADETPDYSSYIDIVDDDLGIEIDSDTPTSLLDPAPEGEETE